MREQFFNIKQNREIRQNLIAMKAELKETQAAAVLWELFAEEPEVLLTQLQSEDAKIRKHTALILGALGSESCRDALWDAYQRENQRFVRSAYLTGLQGCDCAGFLTDFRMREKELLSQERTPETEKHISEELEALHALIYQYEKPDGHRFTGWARPSEVILTTHRAYREVTADQIQKGTKKLLGAGVKVCDADLEELCTIRTWRELLFCLELPRVACLELPQGVGEAGTGTIRKETAAEQLLASNLLKLLEELHEGKAPYRFRIECKGTMTLEKRSAFTKKLASRLEAGTKGKLVNSTSDYEIELRLIETKQGGILPLLKLYTLSDKRFSYRKNSVAASIQPVHAALMMELASPYLKEEARVLDPFCGVGTMLLERNYRMHADTLYGVDLYGLAVAGARENAQIARVPAHYINKDFFSFTHEYLFDEIVTNLPVKGKTMTGHELDFLYGKFFDKAEQMVKPGGLLLLYSHDKAFVKKQLREHKSMNLLKEWLIGDKEGSWFFAVRYQPAGK